MNQIGLQVGKLKHIAILAVFGALATVSLYPRGAESTPKQGVAKQSVGREGKKQTDTKPEDQNTNKTPSVIVQVESPPNDTHSAEDQENLQLQRNIALFTKWLAGATVALVVVGILQFVLLVRQEDILRGARDAIHAQDEHMTASERAWVLVTRTRDETKFRWRIKNFGRTPARIVAVTHSIYVMEPNEIFPNETPIQSAKLSCLPSILAPDEDWKFSEFDANLWPNVVARNKALYFTCLIRYRDVLRTNEIHETEIAMIYDSVGDFSPIDSDKYNRAT